MAGIELEEFSYMINGGKTMGWAGKEISVRQAQIASIALRVSSRKQLGWGRKGWGPSMTHKTTVQQ